MSADLDLAVEDDRGCLAGAGPFGGVPSQTVSANAHRIRVAPPPPASGELEHCLDLRGGGARHRRHRHINEPSSPLSRIGVALGHGLFPCVH